MCAQRGFSSCNGILKYKLKVGLVIPSQLENPLCVHISNGLFYQVYFTYIVSNWDPNLYFMSQFM